MPSATTPEEMLELLCTMLFPDGRLVDYLVSNITLKADPFLLIRPQELLPSHCAEWPHGTVLAAKGQIDRRTGQFRVVDINDMRHFPARAFERSLKAVPMRGHPRTGESVELALTPAWVQALPLISIQTEAALAQWTAYLDWKQKLVQAGIAGVRYLSRTLQQDGTWRFVLALPATQNGANIDRLLRNDDLCAYALDYSSAPWTFSYRENSKVRAQALGDAVAAKTVSLERATLPLAPSLADLPDAQFRQVDYRLAESQHEKFIALVEAEGADAAVEDFDGALPATGFLAVSAVGDLALIRRQREELERLQKESGFAPFVSAYLFDITQARVPDYWQEIGDDQWLRTGMNADQRKAVQMMVNTPDLSLIQGPPGTGKTTMIAEAIYHLTRQGKKVLVASQANLAVDNALERLGNVPTIRALRLGAKADKDSAFTADNALGTYYRSIAGTCKKLHLDKWEATLAESRSLSEWIDTTELIASDLRQADERIALARALNERTGADAHALERRLDAAGARQVRLDEARAFLGMIESNESDWSGTLPDDLRQPWHESVSKMHSVLTSASLKAGRPLGWHDPAAGAVQSRSLFSVLSTCKNLVARLPSLRNEARRLAGLETEELVSAETESLVAALTAEKTRLWALAEDGDDAALARAREIAQQVKAASRNSGLARELYEEVFDPVRASDMLSANATRATVVVSLERAIGALRYVRAWESQARSSARTQLAAATSAAEDPAPFERQLAELRRGLRDLAHQLEQDALRRARHHAQLGVQLDTPLPGGDWQAAYAQVLSAKRAHHEAVSGRLRQTESLRKEWAPVLSEWVKNLQVQGRPNSDKSEAVQYFTDSFLQNCNVVGVTCSERRSTLNDAKHDYFDVAIIDEVSKATPPELLMCIAMARTAILVGDHRQLPPVFKEGISAEQYLEENEDQDTPDSNADSSGSALTRDNLDRFSEMVSASLFKRHFEEAPDPLKVFLFTQYRMHPQIMDVVNAFYEGRLTCGLSDPNGLDRATPPDGRRLHGVRLLGPEGIPYLETDQHVLWVDSGKTPEGREAFERRMGAGGKVNDTEAALIAKVLSDLDQACAAQGYGAGGKGLKRVGIVTFYARQIRVIKDAIAALVRERGPFLAIDVDVNTADRYQGQERPIIIVSLVRCPPHKLSSRANTAQFERINVAFSRAQELLVIMGAERVFRGYEIDLPNLDRPGKSRRAVYGQIIGEIELNGGLKRARQLVDPAAFARLIPASAADGAAAGLPRSARPGKPRRPGASAAGSVR